MTRENKRISRKQWNRSASNDGGKRNKMNNSNSYHRNRSFDDGMWMDIDDLFDDGDISDHDWNYGVDVADDLENS